MSIRNLNTTIGQLQLRVETLERKVEQLFNQQAGMKKAFEGEFRDLWESLRRTRGLIRKSEVT